MREEGEASRRNASETDSGHRKVTWFFLGGAVFLLLGSAYEVSFGAHPYALVGGALVAASPSRRESRRQRRAEREYDERG